MERTCELQANRFYTRVWLPRSCRISSSQCGRRSRHVSAIALFSTQVLPRSRHFATITESSCVWTQISLGCRGWHRRRKKSAESIIYQQVRKKSAHAGSKANRGHSRFPSILLVLLSPLMTVVAAFIKLRTRGPAFFLQERVGRNKRRFLIYKFCTMVPNAEQLC